MGTIALLGSEFHLDAVDRACEISSFSLSYSAAEQDVTSFCQKGTRKRAGGRKDWTLDLSGFFDPSSGDFGSIGSNSDVLLVPDPTGSGLEPAEGDTAFIGYGMAAGYDVGGSHGDIAPFSLRLGSAGTAPLARGRLIAVTAGAVTNETSTARQIYGADGANARLIVAIAALTPGGSGGTIDVTVSTDDNAGMTSATTQHATGSVGTSGTEYSTIIDLGDCSADDYVQTEIDADAAVTQLYVAVGVYVVAA
ncbi:MAG: hypothetical protein GY929_09675 [Actinomycetia bacterium]|nr:hypothetical protein [Actinomycetes bacterium]